jgi:hypothetical protein
MVKATYKKQPLYTPVPPEVEAIYEQQEKEAHERRNAPVKAADLAELAKLEDTIHRSLQAFLEAGQAIKQIRDKKLWRHEYASFESYCRKRWQWSKRHSNTVIAASEVKLLLGPSGPANVRVARELAPLAEQPDTVREVWEQITKGHPTPTATVVRSAVDQRRAQQAQSIAAPKAAAFDCVKRATEIHDQVRRAIEKVPAEARGETIRALRSKLEILWDS